MWRIAIFYRAWRPIASARSCAPEDSRKVEEPLKGVPLYAGTPDMFARPCSYERDDERTTGIVGCLMGITKV